MKSYGHTALALLGGVLVVGLVSALFTQAPGPGISTPPADTDSIATIGEPDERRAGPAATGASPGQGEPGGREAGLSVVPVERFIAPPPPVRDAAPAYPEVDPRPERRKTVLGNLLFVIRDYHEVPLPRVLIRLNSEFGAETALTGSGGEAAFGALFAGRYSYRVEAPERPELAAASLALAEGEERMVELWLGDYDRSLEGRILDQEGKPVAGLTVTARPYHGPAATDSLVAREQRAESGPNGWFELTGLGAGEHELRTLATDRYASARTIVRAGADGAVLLVTERRTLKIIGQVTDAAGKPLAGVEVSELWGRGRRTRSDAVGEYSLSFEASGSSGHHRFRFELKGYRPEHLALEAAARRDEGPMRLDARLEPIEQTLEVAAYLMDEQGVPVVGERMHLYSRRLNTQYQGMSDAEGRVVLPAVLPSSDYRLSVLPKARYETILWPSLDLMVEPPPLEIVLKSRATGGLRGRMVDVGGEPVPHFSMWLHSDQARGQWTKVVGDGSGYFEVTDVPDGRLTLQTRSEPQFRTTGIELAAGSEAYVEIVLDWGEYFLERRIVNEKGEPLAGARIRLDWLDGEWLVGQSSIRQSVTDSTGAFVLSRLGGGPYGLRVSAAGHATKQLGLGFGEEWVQVRLLSLEQ